MQNPWRIDVSEIKDEYVDPFKFFFDQAEKRLRWSLEVGDRITARCYLLVAAVLPLMTLLMSILGRYYILEEVSLKKVIGFCWLGMVITLAVMILLATVMFPRLIHQLGRQPKHIAMKQYFDNGDYKEKKAVALLLKFEIEDYQKRIEYTEMQNASRVYRFKLALILICVGFGLSLGVILYRCVEPELDKIPCLVLGHRR